MGTTTSPSASAPRATPGTRRSAALKLKWVPEIREKSPGAPIILVGTKVDLHKNARDARHLSVSSRQRQVSRKEAEKVVRELGLVTLLDCSAVTQAGLKSVFDEAIIAAIE